MKLSKNISLKELECKCGCGTNFDYPAYIAYEAQKLLEECGGNRIIITSGCRCESHNAKIGGAKRSMHLPQGGAIDFYIPGIRFSEVRKSVDRLWPSSRGFQIYSRWMHFDIRKTKWR